MRLNFFLLCLAFASLPVSGVAQSCLADKQAYDALAQQLIMQTKADTVRLSSSKITDLTLQLHDIVKGDLRKQIELGQTDPEIKDYLKCLQRSSYFNLWDEESNLPFASETEGAPTLRVFAYWLIRGGTGIPSTKPYMEIFGKKGAGWSFLTTFEPEFTESTFFVHSITSSQNKELLILSGFHIGDPQTALSVQILEKGTQGFTKVYESQRLPRAKLLSISSDFIAIEQEVPRLHGSRGDSSQIEKIVFDQVLANRAINK